MQRLWQRAVPPEWQAALERVSGTSRNERVPWLLLVWDPGETWAVVERWIIYEMIPVGRLLANPLHREQAQVVLDALRGPPPVSLRSWHIENGKRVLHAPCPVTQLEWELYRRTGCYGRPYWVIQGAHGGHKRWLSPVEQRVLKLAGRPSVLPGPGDLPYADWDRRVEEALGRERALLDQQSLVRDLETRTDADYRAEMRQRERTLAKDLLAHLDAQMAAVVDDVKYDWNPSDLPAGRAITDEEMEAAEAEFVEATITHTPEE